MADRDDATEPERSAVRNLAERALAGLRSPLGGSWETLGLGRGRQRREQPGGSTIPEGSPSTVRTEGDDENDETREGEQLPRAGPHTAEARERILTLAQFRRQPAPQSRADYSLLREGRICGLTGGPMMTTFHHKTSDPSGAEGTTPFEAWAAARGHGPAGRRPASLARAWARRLGFTSKY